MTQQQGPYQGPYGGGPVDPGYYAAPGADARAAARRAGVMMWVLGSLAVLGGLCCGILGAFMPQFIQQQPELMKQMPPEVTPQILVIGFVVLAAIGVIYGAVQIVLGVYVRRGSKGAIITAMVLTLLMLGYLAFGLVSTIVEGASAGGAQLVGGLCTVAVPGALYGLLMAWLAQALKNVPAVRAQEQYQAQYLAYLQHQQAEQSRAQQAEWQKQQQVDWQRRRMWEEQQRQAGGQQGGQQGMVWPVHPPAGAATSPQPGQPTAQPDTPPPTQPEQAPILPVQPLIPGAPGVLPPAVVPPPSETAGTGEGEKRGGEKPDQGGGEQGPGER